MTELRTQDNKETAEKVIRYRLTDGDYLNFNEYHYLRSSMGKGIAALFTAVCPAVAALEFLHFVRAGQSGRDLIISGAVLLFISLFWILIAKRFYTYLVRRNVLKKRPEVLEKVREGTLAFGEDEIVDTAGDYVNRVPVSKLKKIAEDGDAMYVYVGPASAFILKNNFFVSQKEKRRFREYLEQLINKKR